MTAYPGAFVEKDGSGNGVTPLGARLALGGLIAHDGSGALEARPGVFYDGVGAVVAGTSDTGTMTYQIRPAVFALLLGAVAGNGVVYSALDAVETVNTGAAPGSGSRTDRIWVRQHHVSTDSGGPDTDTVLEFGVAQGVAIPTGALELATASVTAGTTETDSLTITQTHNWVVAAGAPIVVRSQAERDALTPYDGLSVYRLDVHLLQVYTGSGWSDLRPNTKQSYVPALTGATTNPTLGSGSSQIGSYVNDGNRVIGTADIVFGSSGVNPGSGLYAISIPAAIDAGGVTVGRIVGQGVFVDVSAPTASQLYDVKLLAISTTTCRLVVPQSGLVSSSFPVVPAAGDRINVNFGYVPA